MNKKGKNKKGKVPNPTPTQEVTYSDKIASVICDEINSDKTTDVIEKIEDKIENVKEERVPEIISEIIPPSVETKDEETPKKPKRCRGKKKKGKENDFEENLEDEPKETAIEPILMEMKEDNPVIDAIDTLVMTPITRKKKNKKKTVDQNMEQPIQSNLEQMTVVSTADVTKEPELKVVKQEIPSLPEAEVQEIKPPKKKSKKKKRNDSERSEKEEISCTTAFQKLIETTNESTDLTTEDPVVDDVIQVESIKAEIETLLEKDLLTKELTAEKSAEHQEEISAKDQNPEQLLAIECKGKKKNRKDKKPISPSVENISSADKGTVQMPSLSIDNSANDDFPKDSETPDLITQETSPKLKAKIAKPVEKKRKGTQESQSAENIPHDISDTERLQAIEQPMQVILDIAKIEVTEKEIKFEERAKNIQSDCQREPIDLNIPKTQEQYKDSSVEKFEPLNISDKPTGKKRKKELKVPRTPDVSFEILDSTIQVDPKQLDSEIVDTNKDLPTKSETGAIRKQDTCARSDVCKVPTTLESQVQPALTVELIPQCDSKSHVLLTPEFREETEAMKLDTLATEKKEDTQKIEIKSIKKRKKSPKPPTKAENKQKGPAVQVITPFEGVSPTPEVTKEIEDKIDATSITRIYDIEISSIKPKTPESLICDTIPDVTYPRSVSQQLMDDNNNNNTSIIEVLPSLDIIPDTQKEEFIDTPKIDTTVKSKEATSPPKEEKTDLKSKMMEVNQDMEELRLSIERSLAELTSIEKSEEVIEKRYEEIKPTAEETQQKISHIDIILIKDDHKNICCNKPDAEKFAFNDSSNVIKSTENIVAVTQESVKTFEIPLLPADDNKKSTMAKTLEKDLIEIKPDIPECSTSSKGKKITAEELKYVSPIVDTTIDSVISMITNQGPDNSSNANVTIIDNKKLTEQEKNEAITATATPLLVPSENIDPQQETEKKDVEKKLEEPESQLDTPSICPTRKDQKNKHKKKKGKQDSQITPQPSQSTQSTSYTVGTNTTQESKKQEKTDTKNSSKSGSKDNKEKGKQQTNATDAVTERELFSEMDYEPIENFEDALTSSVDDVNKTFELIVKESQEQSNPKINVIPPNEQKPHVSPSKNLLGHPDIPVSSNKRDYKKEKDKIPNEITAMVNIKDAVHVERKQSKNTQTVNKLKDLNDCKLSDNEEFVYKYNFRKVFLQSSCHLCKKELGTTRLACCYCNLLFYCGIKHKDEDWPQHQALCFAVSTIGHLKDQKHIYADTKNVTGHDYRLIRMQMIVSCEKILKRRLVPWEQEALLYPRVCAHVPCREWRQMKLSDCQGCGQISFCTDNQDHYPKAHSRWCKSYSLYQKLVCYQQSKGRLEPRLPTRVMQEPYTMPENINEVLAAMYEEKIDMNDIQYAALTQLATAPLTAAYCYQLCGSKNIKANGYKKSILTIHVVGAELQFEADALNKWEVFFLHLRPDLQELRVVLINYNLNPSNLPLELLGKIKLCEQCRQDKRRVVLRFQDKRTYAEYKRSEDFIVPDIVCAFNPSIQRSSIYNGKDPWPSAISNILKQKVPFIITGYTITELHKDCIRVKECSEIESKFISEPKLNSFASVRPDRNFITDDEMPLLFKNYCYAIICG